MANIGQATFIGGDIIIKCDDSWTCCQREQARAKVQGLNSKCPMTVKSRVSKISKRAKKNCQSRETNRLISEMEADPQAGAANNATSPCLAEQMEQDWNSGNQSTSSMNVQMDHPQEAKFSGPTNTTLKALDTPVNNFFGQTAKNVGNEMRKQGQDSVESVSLVCKPPCKPPKKGDEKKSYSTGKRRAFPSNPAFVTPKSA